MPCKTVISKSVHTSKIQALTAGKVCPCNSMLLIFIKFRFQLSAQWQISYWNVISHITKFSPLPHPLPFPSRAVLNLASSDLCDKRATRPNWSSISSGAPGTFIQTNAGSYLKPRLVLWTVGAPASALTHFHSRCSSTGCRTVTHKLRLIQNFSFRESAATEQKSITCGSK